MLGRIYLMLVAALLLLIPRRFVACLMVHEQANPFLIFLVFHIHSNSRRIMSIDLC